MEKSFKSVATSAEKMGVASSSLEKSIEDFTPAVQKTLGTIQDKFVASIEASGKIMENAGVAIKDAVQEMSDETKKGQNELQNTLIKFQNNLFDIMLRIKKMTSDIGKQTENSKKEMENIRAEICTRLNAISSSNIMVTDAIKKLPLDEIREYLGISLQNLKQPVPSKVDK